MIIKQNLLKPGNVLERTISVLVLIVMHPVEVFNVIFWSVPFAIAALWRRDPKPAFPAVPKPDNYDDVDLPEIYSNYAKELVEDVRVEPLDDPDEHGYILKAKGSPEVRYFSDKSKVKFAGIDIGGMGTGYWNTDEAKDLDEYFWISVAVLKNGLHKRRSKLGVNEVWVKLDDQDVWYHSTDDGAHYVDYGGYRQRFHE